MTQRPDLARILLPLAFMLCPLVTACASPTAPGAVQVRVRNASAQAMDNVILGFPYPDGEINYGDLAPGEASGYRVVEEAYRYAAARVVVAGDTLRLTPIDYVGETPLEPGRHTYRLSLFDDRNLTLKLE